MGHHLLDKMSLEMHRLIAEQLPSRPEWMTLARENLARWRERNLDSPGVLRLIDEWQSILDRGIECVRRALTDTGEEGVRLRHNSPFPGALTPKQVWDIKARVRDEAA